VSTSYVVLAVLMLAVTYPSRAIPLLAPGLERLPAWALSYLQLVAPAVLATLAATSTLVATTSTGRTIHVGVAAASVVLCVVVVIRRRNLLLGLTVAVAFAALVRTVG
jgi:branched-subunit amino acid transport protein